MRSFLIFASSVLMAVIILIAGAVGGLVPLFLMVLSFIMFGVLWRLYTFMQEQTPPLAPYYGELIFISYARRTGSQPVIVAIRENRHAPMLYQVPKKFLAKYNGPGLYHFCQYAGCDVLMPYGIPDGLYRRLPAGWAVHVLAAPQHDDRGTILLACWSINDKPRWCAMEGVPPLAATEVPIWLWATSAREEVGLVWSQNPPMETLAQYHQARSPVR